MLGNKTGHFPKEMDIEEWECTFVAKKWTLGNKTGHSQMRKWTLSSKIRHSNKIVWIYEKISNLPIDIL